jgi:hypothetical protein
MTRVHNITNKSCHTAAHCEEGKSSVVMGSRTSGYLDIGHDSVLSPFSIKHRNNTLSFIIIMSPVIIGAADTADIFWDVSCSLVEVSEVHTVSLNKEVANITETSVYSYQITRCNIPEDCQLHTRCRENLKSHPAVTGTSSFHLF